MISTAGEHMIYSFSLIFIINKTYGTFVNYCRNCLFFRKGMFFDVFIRCY